MKQSVYKHHSFQLELPYDALQNLENHNLDEAQNFLGKRLTVVIAYKDVIDSPERTFVGVITEVSFTQNQGSLGSIVLVGFDPTILLDGAKHTQSFGGEKELSLNTIAYNVIREALSESRFDFRVASNYTRNIPYSCQYNETHYNYLARMAEAYGEQFFHDGEFLHFGKLPSQETPLELIYGSNISNIKVKMRAVHVKPAYYAYNSDNNEKLTAATSVFKHRSDIASRAFKIAENVYKTPSTRIAPVKSSTAMDVGVSQKGAVGSKAVEVFVTTGNTSLPFLYPGCAADIEMRRRDTNKTSYFTKLLITETTHEIDMRGYYTGTFEAIAADTGYLPRPEFEIPVAEPQIATVKSNTDSKNQGRVQVQFDWQLHDTTDFIRVMSPDAGGTDAVTQNRGYVAIPEIGDQVMIGFEHNHPDFPFVMGGMFHGKNGLGGGVQNHMRSIQTKSGIKVLMNDNEKSVAILDPSGNTYFMDGNGNINITAPNKITMDATDIHMNANNNFDINVGNNMTSIVGNTAMMNIMQKMLINSPILLQTITELFHAQAAKTIINTENELFIQAKETSVAGTQKLFMHSDENTIVNSKGVVDMHGKQGNNQTNKAQPYKKIPIYMDGRCFVSFRPKTSWKGEYGFDWMRVGDTSLPGDTKANAYKYISTDYNNLKKAYQRRIFTRNDSRGRRITFTYFVPWLTLYPINEVPKGFTHTSATFDVTIDVEVEPIRLEVEYDKTLFTVDKQSLSQISKGVHKTTLTVTCIKSFDKYQDIKVVSVFKNAKGEEEKALAGKMLVTPNKQRFKVDCVIVKVHTNINGTPIKSDPSLRKQSTLNKYLRQALVNPNFKSVIDLDFRSNVDSSGKTTKLMTLFNNAANVIGGKIPDGATDDIQIFLNDQVRAKYGSKYDDVYKFYFIAQTTGGLYGRAFGIPSAAKSVVVYKPGFTDSTIAHEGLHAMGLEHPFHGGEHMFRRATTDNIMDYSDIEATPAIPVIQLWHWQLPFIYKNVKPI